MARRLFSPRTWRGKTGAVACEPSSSSAPPSIPPPGYELLLARLDDRPAGETILAALADHYAVNATEEDVHVVRVHVADARFPDEAVVRLASVLDDIDRDWERFLSWPRIAKGS